MARYKSTDDVIKEGEANPNFPKLSITTFAQKAEALRAQLREEGKKALSEMIAQFFEAYPEIRAIGWSQYTPYFNDGDACRFGVGDPYFSTKEYVGDGSPYAFFEGDWDSEEEGQGAEERGKIFQTWDGDAADPRLYYGMKVFEKGLNTLEDELEAVLGDHIFVVATREGVQTYEYEHD